MTKHSYNKVLFSRMPYQTLSEHRVSGDRLIFAIEELGLSKQFKRFPLLNGDKVIRIRKNLNDEQSMLSIIEEIVSLGAIEIYLTSNLVNDLSLDSIPTQLRKRVKLITNPTNYDKAFPIIWQDIEDEFCSQKRFIFYLENEPNFLDSLLTLNMSLQSFLSALNIGAQVDVDYDDLAFCVRSVRQHSNNPKTRSYLAIVEGLLFTYEKASVDCLQLKSDNTNDNVKLFLELIEEESYKQLSMFNYQLGFPKLRAYIMQKIKKSIETVTTKSPFKEILNIGSRGILASTNIPVPDSEMASMLLKKKYLPPIFSIEPLRKKLDYKFPGIKFS